MPGPVVLFRFTLCRADWPAIRAEISVGAFQRICVLCGHTRGNLHSIHFTGYHLQIGGERVRDMWCVFCMIAWDVLSASGDVVKVRNNR